MSCSSCLRPGASSGARRQRVDLWRVGPELCIPPAGPGATTAPRGPGAAALAVSLNLMVSFSLADR